MIGNQIHDTDSAALGEDICSGLSGPTDYCPVDPEGKLSFRYLLNGTDFDDYLRILNPGERLRLLLNFNQDSGGVHYNSAIGTTLSTIRSRLARTDGSPATPPSSRSPSTGPSRRPGHPAHPTSGFIRPGPGSSR